jgi:hypothetical protein
MAYSGSNVAFLGELIALENRLSRGYGDGQGLLCHGLRGAVRPALVRRSLIVIAYLLFAGTVATLDRRDAAV